MSESQPMDVVINKAASHCCYLICNTSIECEKRFSKCELASAGNKEVNSPKQFRHTVKFVRLLIFEKITSLYVKSNCIFGIYSHELL